jgi:hypothetical protein
MMRETRQGCFGGRAVRAFGQGDAQDFGTLDRIFPKGLVEIPHPKKQKGPGVTSLDLGVLLHQGRFASGLGRHIWKGLWTKIGSTLEGTSGGNGIGWALEETAKAS